MSTETENPSYSDQKISPVEALSWQQVTLERLGLTQDELQYTHPDRRYSTRYTHLEGGIFRTEISGIADLETVQGEFAIEDKVISRLQRYGLTYYQLCVLAPQFRITPDMRFALKQRAPEYERRNGGMAFVGSRGLIRGIAHFILLFFPTLRMSFHRTEEEGLGQLRQWVRMDFESKGLPSPYPARLSGKSPFFGSPGIWARFKEWTEKETRDSRASIPSEIILDESINPLALLSKERRFLYVNNALSVLLGKKPEDFLGSEVFSTINEDDAHLLEAELKEILIHGKPLGDVTLQLVNQNSELTLVRCVISSLKKTEMQEEGYLLQFQDLREVWEFQQLMDRELKAREQVTKELQLAKEEADRANLAKSRFLATMSHEFRTPLNSISGFTQILIEDAKQLSLPETLKQNLKHVKTSAETLSELINHVLDFSKIDAGEMQVVEDVIDPKQFMRSVYHMHQPVAQEKGVVFSYDPAPDLPPAIQGDRVKLSQILMNLISNAIKFTPEGKSVVLKSRKRFSKLLLEVMDEGIGIPPDRIFSIFEPFAQADDSTTRKYGGTGLGLSITRELVQLLGGEIKVESRIGEGSTFTVSIPVIEISNDSIYEVPDSVKSVCFAPGSRVLVVEDNFMNQEMICQVFRRMGLEIKIAADGLQGVQAARSIKPDLILMDMHLPVIDGLEAIRRIRRFPDNPDVPIIAFSADAFHEQQELAFDAGANDYLIKPLNFTKLYPVLRMYLKHEITEGTSPRVQESLPSGVDAEIRRKLETISGTPPYLSAQIVSMAEEIIECCCDYDTDFRKLAELIRQYVYSNKTHQIPALIMERLQG